MSRLIHKYSNRRLYDTCRGRAITLLELADIVLDGEEVRVEHRSTHEDITTVTLLHALVERLKRHPDDAVAGRIAERLVAALDETRDVVARESRGLEKAGVGIV
jgi:polyhydroxyalkanoate synthesis regulator protein